jgi:D-alanyl-D-alanine carboxypeptidase
MLIEHLDGIDLNTSLQRRIANPLGLESTVFALPAGPEDLVAAWSADLFEGDPDFDYTSIATSAWAAGALVSSTDDLATFLEGLVDGTLLSEASLAEMTDTADDGYGLGMFEAAFGPGELGFGHSGGIPGYTATMAINPENGDLVVVVTNNDFLIADLLVPLILASW